MMIGYSSLSMARLTPPNTVCYGAMGVIHGSLGATLVGGDKDIMIGNYRRWFE